MEIDVLTGEKNVRRVDLMQDTGSSMSPLVDLGQIEGAFIMSLGLWLTEEITFDPDTGRLLNFDTWVRLSFPAAFCAHSYLTERRNPTFFVLLSFPSAKSFPFYAPASLLISIWLSHN